MIGSLNEYPHIIAEKSKLINTEAMFAECSGISGDLPSDYFKGCTALQNINNHFHSFLFF